MSCSLSWQARHVWTTKHTYYDIHGPYQTIQSIMILKLVFGWFWWICFRMSHSDAQIFRLDDFSATVSGRCHSYNPTTLLLARGHRPMIGLHQAHVHCIIGSTTVIVLHVSPFEPEQSISCRVLCLGSTLCYFTIDNILSVWKRSRPLSNFFWSFCK